MICERIKLLRESVGITQAELARKLGITRSSINAWEMGISVPSTQYIVQLASFFHVSSDYLLGIDKNTSLDVEGLNDEEIAAIHHLITLLRDKK